LTGRFVPHDLLGKTSQFVQRYVLSAARPASSVETQHGSRLWKLLPEARRQIVQRLLNSKTLTDRLRDLPRLLAELNQTA